MTDVQINIIDRKGNSIEVQAPTDMELNLMELCKANDLPVKGTCGGMALCSTCHIYIESNHNLKEMSVDEEDMLDQAFFVKDNSRLGCQIRINKDLDNLVIRLAPEDNEI